MQNSPDLLTRALQNPTLLEAELGRRRARDGTDGDVLAWIEATFGVRIPAVACCEGHVAPAKAFCDALRARAPVALWIASRGFGGKTFLLALLAAANAILFETDVIDLGWLWPTVGAGGRTPAPPVGRWAEGRGDIAGLRARTARYSGCSKKPCRGGFSRRRLGKPGTVSSQPQWTASVPMRWRAEVSRLMVPVAAQAARLLAREIYQRVMTDFRARQEIIQAA